MASTQSFFRNTCHHYKHIALSSAAILLGLFLVSPVTAQQQQPVPTVNVVVQVTGQESEQPLDQARVELVRFPDGILQMSFTDGLGRLEFFRLIPQSYIIRVSKMGYRTTEVNVDVRRGEYSKTVPIQLRREDKDEGKPSPAAGVISARTLSIPKPAMDRVQKGVQFLNEKKDAKRAIREFEEAIRLFPDYYEAWFMIGTANMQLKAFENAQKSFEKSVEINPEFVRPYYPLAVLLESQKRHEEAERLLLRAIELDPKGWEGPFELARSYANRNQWEKALHYGEMAHSRPAPAPKVHLLMADLCSSIGQIDKAIEELEKFIRLEPTSPYVPKARSALDQLRKRK